MIKEYKVTTTDTFEDEVKNIYFKIKFYYKKPIKAKNVYNKIIDSIKKLNLFPEKFSKVKNFKNLNLHRLIINNYIVIYEVNNEKAEVYILHIFFYNQNYLNLL